MGNRYTGILPPCWHRLPLRAREHWAYRHLASLLGRHGPKKPKALRSVLVDAPFLIPGFGAQGAGAKKATSGLTRGKHGWEGGLINSTRGLIFPKKAASAGSIDEWRHAIAETIAENKTILNRVF
jgi:orotidine-5'-phosphate decarboxylase